MSFLQFKMIRDLDRHQNRCQGATVSSQAITVFYFFTEWIKEFPYCFLKKGFQTSADMGK